jgi:hypothetical protein
LMVPKTWVTKILILKLLNLSLSLANQLSMMTWSMKGGEADADESEETAGFEVTLDREFNQYKAIRRVNRLALESKNNHSQYAEQLVKSDKRILEKLNRNGDFEPLVKNYRHQVHLNLINFNSVASGAERWLDNSSIIRGQ